MASLINTTRINLAPSVRALSSGVPASAVKFTATSHGHGSHEHHYQEPAKGIRADLPPKWVFKSDGFMQTGRVNGEFRPRVW